ncbi:MAG: protein kinase rio1 [Chaenotheca gracillima]|nr:MAG: protein kinase rio1 [Chaenotheca gracillima]
MAEEKHKSAGLIDLEKELTCSICTEVLYQPQTLLDCLHTFCGSCLKGWFAFQASHPPSSSRSGGGRPFTCPSCRASVRETRPNATVTTLLDMFLQANPGRAKSDQEKAEIALTYQPGEKVLPSVTARPRTEEDEEDSRLMAEVRDLSMREHEARLTRVGGGGGQGSSSESEQRRRRARSHDSRVAEAQSHPQRRRAQAAQSAAREEESDGARNRSHSQAHSPTRQIEHQSSLRSLLSTSEVDPSEIQEEILRQIAEEGLLDGVDLSNLDRSQEDELSERIAAAYRRRHNERARPQRNRRSESDGTSASESTRDRPGRTEHTGRRSHARSQSAATEAANVRLTSASTTHLEAPRVSGQRRRCASNGSSRRASPPASGSARSSTGNLPTGPGRSSTDLSARSTQPRPSRLVQQGRSSTDPEHNRASQGRVRDTAADRAAGPPPSGGRSEAAPSERAIRPAAVISTGPVTTSPPQASESTFPSSSDAPPPSQNSALLEVPNHQEQRRSSPNRRPAPLTSSSNPPRTRTTLYPEPSITCERCKREHIEYELFFNCDKCKGGEYNLCLSCYRAGKGCDHWYGFGYAAWHNYERRAPAGGYLSGHALPHTLTGQRYLRPKQSAVQQPASNGASQRRLTSEDPLKRLEAGVFCSMCLTCANDCYWKCDVCNEGEWGFCNRCVNTGKCCTHPLLPLIDTSRVTPKSPSTPSSRTFSRSTQPAGLPPSASLLRSPAGDTPATGHGNLKPLTFTTSCDICRLPIQPSSARFHCPVCSDGDYDICTPCYLKLCGPAGKISRENGDKGWRRCLRGHRMQVIGFEDRDGGRKRVVSRDLVGGWALREEPVNSSSIEARGNADASTGPVTDGIAPEEGWTWRDSGNGRRQTRPAAGTTGATHRRIPSASTAAAPQTSQDQPGDSSTQSQNPLTMNFPPDGGVGLRVLALWSYYPAQDVTDELMFPRFAEVTEVEDINGDWFAGGYAGARGLFPGGYVRIIGEKRVS